MITASEFELASVQISIFTPDREAFSQSQLLVSLLSRFPEIYDAPPQSLAPPPGTPPDFPRILLQSTDSTWRLRASPSRVDAHWIRSVDGDECADAVEHCTEVLRYLMQQLNLGVGRIALIFNRFCEAYEPTKALIQRFTSNGAQEGPFHNSSNFEIHNHKLYVLRGLDIPVNSWVRCRTGIVQPRRVQAVTVEQDINTLGEDIDSRVFSVDEFAQFVSEAEGEMENILGLYFPEGE